MTTVKNAPRMQTMKQRIEEKYKKLCDEGSEPSFQALARACEEDGVFSDEWKSERYFPAEIEVCREVITRPGTGQLPIGLPTEPKDRNGSTVRPRERCGIAVRNKSLIHRSRAICFDHEQTMRLYDETIAMFHEAARIPVLGMAVGVKRPDGTVVVLPIQLSMIDDLFPE